MTAGHEVGFAKNVGMGCGIRRGNCIQDKDDRSSRCGVFMRESLQVRELKTILDSGFHAMDSGFQVLYSGFFISGTWIPHSNRQWDSGFLEQYSVFQSPGFQISQAKIPCILDSASTNFSYSGIRIPLHGAKREAGMWDQDIPHRRCFRVM